MSELLSPSECAKRLNVTGEYIRGEIKAGRLKARVRELEKRNLYRIDPNEFDRYVEQFWPERVSRRSKANRTNRAN